MKLIHKYINLLGYKVNYKGNFIKKKDIIEVFNNKEKNECKTIGEVTKCKCIRKVLTDECVMEIVFQKENNPFSL